ncbi:MAG: NAD-dependent epimerase/dehydratase family protein [Deltaproteobacteria bacterium]|jgi:nucleoside-diphosphate-sugar epimerase|nr:NAD-dependent epimerase/dehydratase family protein [Deltaproteobacteria bacterium]
MRVLLTGASGFLGRRVAELFLDHSLDLRIFSRRDVPELAQRGAKFYLGTFEETGLIKDALLDVDAVVHSAGKTGLHGPYEDFYTVNTLYTSKLLEAAKASGSVKYFVYTSTPSVVYRGGNLENASESAPYVDSKESAYSYSKMEAEKIVLGANSPDFLTLALRPHLIWGPRDPHFLPRIFDLEKRGKLFFFSGGPYKVSHTYIDNAAWAHVQALRKIVENPKVGGEAYFIAEPEPMDLKTLINRLLSSGGRGEVTKTLNKHLGLAMAKAVEFIWKALRLKSEPPLSVFAVKQLSSSHYFNLTKAYTYLDYQPKIKTEDAFLALSAYLKDHPPA